MNDRIEIHSQPYQILLSGFNNMVRAIGYKSAETGSMQRMVKEFLHYLETHGMLRIKSVTALDMVAYYEYLCQRPNLRRGGLLSSSTITDHMGSIELFNQYLLHEGIITQQINLPKHKHKDAKERNILTYAEVTQLYAVSETKRDRAMLSLAYGSGMRRSEIANLQMADLQLSKGMLVVRKGKNCKRREIPLPEAVIRDLKDYLVNERHMYLKKKNSFILESFLVNNKGHRMNGDHLQRQVKRTNPKNQKPRH